jgi:prevent-host-death family protein
VKAQPEDTSRLKRVGVFAAKTHFSALIDDAIAGKTTVITKRGKSVAHIVPVNDTQRERTRQAVERLRAIRGGLKLAPGETIRDLIDERRR